MKFAILGVAGYIAPRHLKAIRETGNELVAAIDLNDSVGVLDQYFPDVKFYNDFDHFKKQHGPVDYISICVPNHLHFNFIKDSLNMGMNVVCEKPLVVYPDHLNKIEDLERNIGKTVNSILQLRLHPVFMRLKNTVGNEKHKITLEYITPRGPWYHESWKGCMGKSGGLAMNVGVHFFDALIWLFGSVQNVTIHYSSSTKIGGKLELERASVNWFLSIDKSDIPEATKSKGQSTHRLIVVDGQEVEFSEGFTNLHTASYQQILSGNGYRINDVRQSIELVYKLYENQRSKS